MSFVRREETPNECVEESRENEREYNDSSSEIIAPVLINNISAATTTIFSFFHVFFAALAASSLTFSNPRTFFLYRHRCRCSVFRFFVNTTARQGTDELTLFCSTSCSYVSGLVRGSPHSPHTHSLTANVTLHRSLLVL